MIVVKPWATILNVLREDLGYFVPKPEIMNAKNFGVPQTVSVYLLLVLEKI